jgi:hypothetical protein
MILMAASTSIWNSQAAQGGVVDGGQRLAPSEDHPSG